MPDLWFISLLVYPLFKEMLVYVHVVFKQRLVYVSCWLVGVSSCSTKEGLCSYWFSLCSDEGWLMFLFVYPLLKQRADYIYWLMLCSVLCNFSNVRTEDKIARCESVF
jgi:hypothetical protein